MSKLYSSKYKELNINYLIKVFFDYKLSIFSVVLLFTGASVYLANSIKPIYEAKALIKIGQYYELQRNGDVVGRAIDSSDELAREVSFNFIGKGKDDASIYKVLHERGIDNYIELIARGSSIKTAKNEIKTVERYISDMHDSIVEKHTMQYKVELNNIVKKIGAITSKQKTFLAKDSYNSKDYASLINTLQLMSIINADLGIGYIGQIIERREKLELLINEPYKIKSQIVGDIQENNNPVSPNKKVIVFFGFFIGLFLSLFTVFVREYLLDENK